MSIDRIPAWAVLAELQHHIGAGNGITAHNLAVAARRRTGIYGTTGPADERRVRKTIEQLRRDGQHICATPETGYFIAETSEELQQTCRFLYERAMTSLTQISRMKNISLPDLEGQLKLRT